MFAYDNIGSSNDVCSDHYRGPFAFSEPETRAIRDLIGNWSNIEVAINLNAYGNSLVYPFNFNSNSSSLLQTNFSIAD